TESAPEPATVTLAPVAKSLPVIVTCVPPLVNPPDGLMLPAVVVKGVLAVKLKAIGADAPPSTLATMTLPVPTASAGVEQRMVVRATVMLQFTPEAVTVPLLKS